MSMSLLVIEDGDRRDALADSLQVAARRLVERTRLRLHVVDRPMVGLGNHVAAQHLGVAGDRQRSCAHERE